jgi:WD40 repeat protein
MLILLSLLVQQSFSQQKSLSKTVSPPVRALIAYQNTLIVGSDFQGSNGIIHIDAVSKATIKTFIGHSGGVNCFFVQGPFLFSGSNDRSIIQYNIVDGTIVRRFAGHTGYVLGITVSNDGKYLYSGGDDRTIRQFDTSTGALLRTLENTHTEKVTSLAVTDRYLYSSGLDSLAKEWDLTNFALQKTFSGHTEGIWALAVQNNHIYTASDDNTSIILIS